MSWQMYTERIIKTPHDKALVREFLARFDLDYSDDLDITLAWFDEESIVATGSLKGEVFRNIAIDDKLQGEGLLATIVSRLSSEAAKRNIYHYFVYTKPNNAYLFEALGFNLIGRADPYAVLLEAGVGNIETYTKDLVAALGKKPRAAIVMNCNPFTLGHRSLIEKAAKENQEVLVFVVEEDLSTFPYNIRFKLVVGGVRDLSNVKVLNGGKYIISSATFPGYFTKEKEATIAQTRLDLDVFVRHIAPALSIVKRYVGEEPYCNVTADYNKAMQEILSRANIELVVVPRAKVGQEIISASKVRQALKNDDWATVSKLVPKTALDFLMSSEAQPIIEKLKGSFSRH